MSALNLFSVEVTRTWSATMEALVWAETKQAAIDAVMAEQDLDFLDAESTGTEYVAWARDLTLLQQLPAKPDHLLLVPRSQRTASLGPLWDEVETAAEFIAFLGSEEGERLRLAVIEHNNGQIALPIEVAA